MKTTNRVHHPEHRIRNLHDLELEKNRLSFEILKVEEKIKYDFRRVMDFFTLKQAFRVVTHDLSLTSKAVSRGFSIIKGLIFRRKNKINGNAGRKSR